MAGVLLEKNESSISFKNFHFCFNQSLIQGCLVAPVKLNASLFSLNQIYHKNPDLVAKVDSFCQLQNALRDDIFKTIFKMSFCAHSCI